MDEQNAHRCAEPRHPAKKLFPLVIPVKQYRHDGGNLRELVEEHGTDGLERRLGAGLEMLEAGGGSRPVC